MLEAHLMSNLEREVAGRAQLVAALAEARRPSASDAAALERLAKELAVEAHGTVELLRADGSLRSRAPKAALPSAEPRSRAGFRGRAFGSARCKASPAFLVEGRSLYSAARFQLPDGSEAVARVSWSSRCVAVDDALAGVSRFLDRRVRCCCSRCSIGDRKSRWSVSRRAALVRP